MLTNKKSKFQLKVSDKERRLLEDMMERAGIDDEYDLFTSASVLLMWVIRQREHGRKIVSLNPDDEQFIELNMAMFEDIKKRYQPDSYESLIDESGKWILLDEAMK